MRLVIPPASSSQIKGSFPRRGHRIETTLESPSREKRVLLSDHKLPFCYWSCCRTPLNCSSHPLYLPLVGFPDSRYNFLDKYSLCPMFSVLRLTSTVWKDFCLRLQTLQWLSSSLSAFKGDHPKDGQTTYLPREPNLGAKGRLAQAAARWALTAGVSVCLSESPSGIQEEPRLPGFWALVKTFWARCPVGGRKARFGPETQRVWPRATEGSTRQQAESRRQPRRRL